MKIATLYRTYHPNFTAGVIPFKDQIIYTVERPWIQEEDAPYRAGKPFESCIPEGLYEVYRFTRRNGDIVWSLSNPDLGVYLIKTGRRYLDDRYACLIHAANRADQVVGCVGPGLGALHRSGGYSVAHSREAMAALELCLADVTHLEIKEYEAHKATN